MTSGPIRRGMGAAVCLLVLAGCGAAAGPSSSSGPGGAPTSPAGTPSTSPEVQLAAPPSPAPPSTASPAPTASPPASPRSAAPAPRPTERPGPKARPVIVIDPGHSGRAIRSRTVNGLLDFDYPNRPEIVEMFDIGSCVARGLRADGYRVVMTKRRAEDSVSLTERARIADRAKADLAISLHDDHSQGPAFQATYSQRGVAVGGRYPAMYRGTGSRRTTFDRPPVARQSERAAKIIARERSRAQGRPVRVGQNSFTGRQPLEPGNLALVQLLSRVPWVYNEMGARAGTSTTTRLSLDVETGYAAGLLAGVEAAVPIAGSTRPTSAATLRACLAARR